MVVNVDLPAKHKHSFGNKAVPDKLLGGGLQEEYFSAAKTGDTATLTRILASQPGLLNASDVSYLSYTALHHAKNDAIRLLLQSAAVLRTQWMVTQQEKAEALQKENEDLQLQVQELQKKICQAEQLQKQTAQALKQANKEIEDLQVNVKELQEKICQAEQLQDQRTQKMMLDCADVVAFMINQCKCNVIVDGSDENGYTALMLSAKHGLKEITSVLSSRSNANMQTNEGVTALMEACSYNQLEVLKVLSASGCDINHTTNEQMNALMLATVKGNTDIVRYLLNQNASIHTSNQLGNTALMLAVEHGHLQIVQLLLENGAGVCTQNSQGHTPLMIAAKQNFVDAATILLTFDPERQLEIQKHNGETALMLASKHGNVELVSLFLQHGADGWKENFQGFTAKILANKFGQTVNEDILTVWERNNPLRLDQKVNNLDLDMTIEQFLASKNLAHLTDLFADSLIMETVGEFKTLNQKKRKIIQNQLSSADLEVLDSSLATMGIFMHHFLPAKSDRQETPALVQDKTNKRNTNDAPA